jgi:hypothetical protein
MVSTIQEEGEKIMAHWIQRAIKHPGRMKKAAAKAGESTHQYMEEKKNAGGSLGRAARLGLTLSKMHKK